MRHHLWAFIRFHPYWFGTLWFIGSLIAAFVIVSVIVFADKHRY